MLVKFLTKMLRKYNVVVDLFTASYVAKKDIDQLAAIYLKNETKKTLQKVRITFGCKQILSNVLTVRNLLRRIKVINYSGCNHMTCQIKAGGCGYQFCWICLGDWNEHGEKTGGFYACNKYENVLKTSKNLQQLQNQQREAQKLLEKYSFYFERYLNNQIAQNFAKQQIQQIQETLYQLSDQGRFDINELQFIVQVVQFVYLCRKALKYTYAYGFYITDQAEKQLFQNLQETLEDHTERLHEMLESDLMKYKEKENLKGFYQFKAQMMEYYKVNQKFLDNCLNGIEAGLTIY